MGFRGDWIGPRRQYFTINSRHPFFESNFLLPTNTHIFVFKSLRMITAQYRSFLSSRLERATSVSARARTPGQINNRRGSGGPGAIVDGGCLRVLVARNCEGVVVVRRG